MTEHPRFITVSRQLIEAGGTSGCGFTNAQIRILDGPGRPRKGWRSRAIGKRLSYERAREFLIDARRPKHRPKPGSLEEAAALALLDNSGVIPLRFAPVKFAPGALSACNAAADDVPPWEPLPSDRRAENVPT